MKHLNSLFIFAFLTISLLTTKAQNSVVIDPDDYSLANPFVIPSLPNGSTFYISIKTGKPVPTIIEYADLESGRHGTPDGRALVNVTSFNIDVPGIWGLTWKQNGAERSIACIVNYQADIYDRTVGSATYGKRPDFIWVSQGGSAKVSAGRWMKWYGWKNLITNVVIANTAIDSVMTFNNGIFIANCNDGSGNLNTWTRDTISILEKPTLNNTAKTLNFSTTTTGITYKLLKVSSISGTDTTWIETQNFVGDGNTKNITLTDGKYKLTTTRGIYTAVYPYGYFVVGITTALDKTKEEKINYRLIDNKLQFDNEVNLKFYSLQGQLLQQEQGSSFKLCRQAGIFKATDKNGNVLTAKIILK